jgi:hypothetical protein
MGSRAWRLRRLRTSQRNRLVVAKATTNLKIETGKENGWSHNQLLVRQFYF